MNTPRQSPSQPATGEITKEELKTFYRQDLPKLLRTFFSEPISGTYSIFANRSGKAYIHSVILIVSTGLIYIVLPYLMLGDARSYTPFSRILRLGLVPVLFMLLITALSFGIKSFSGKADVKNELLTGGLCGIPLSALILLAFVAQLFTDDAIYSVLLNPEQVLDLGLLVVLPVIYLFLMLINIVQQSLKSSGTRDALSWYASPAAILLTFYVTFKISPALF